MPRTEWMGGIQKQLNKKLQHAADQTLVIKPVPLPSGLYAKQQFASTDWTVLRMSH
jgi:hypothetical protein